MSLWTRIGGIFRRTEPPKETTIRGTAYSKPLAMWPWEHIGQLHDIRTKITEIEELDEADGQVKMLHKKLASMSTRGGVRFVMREGENAKMDKIATAWIKRVNLDHRETRKQHAWRLLKHGNLVLQNVISPAPRIESLVVMPTQTMRPLKDDRDQFPDPGKAYAQMDPMGMSVSTTFAKWQISWAAYDKEANKLYGRPLIDAERKRARQIGVTDEDLVIRRRVRAWLRLLHTLEGASMAELEEYKEFNKESLEDPLRPDNDLYTNQKGGVQAIQGDANLDQIADVKYLNQKFYAGAGTHAHLFGPFAEEMNRDTYEDTLADLYELLEDIQEALCDCWEESLRIEFLLNGINSDAYEWDLKLLARKVETPNQQLDRALKERAVGLPLKLIVTETLNKNWELVKEMINEERDEMDAYSQVDDELGDNVSPISIVQGNQRNKDSATYVKNK